MTNKSNFNNLKIPFNIKMKLYEKDQYLYFKKDLEEQEAKFWTSSYFLRHLCSYTRTSTRPLDRANCLLEFPYSRHGGSPGFAAFTA